MRSGQAMILLVVALFTIGVVMVNSASLRLPENPAGVVGASADGTATGFSVTLSHVFQGRYLQLAILAIVAMLATSLVSIEKLASGRGISSVIPWLILFMVGALALTYVPGIGVTQNGATRWIRLGPLGLQPSELIKWGMPLLIAAYCVRNAGSMHRFRVGLLQPVLIAGIFCGVIALEDLGTAVLIMCVVLGILLAAGIRIWQVIAVLPVGILAFIGLVLAEPYRVRRIVSFMHPYADPGDSGYHLVQSLSAIAAGGTTGRGLGHSIQKFGYLPEINSDFIFAMVCEELGIFGAGLVILIFVAILLIGLSIVTGRSVPKAEPVKDPQALVPPMSRLVGLGILLTFGLQALINIAVVTGLAPTKGIALPLVSHGGTGWILTAAALGLVISIDRSACRRARYGQHREPAASPVVA